MKSNRNTSLVSHSLSVFRQSTPSLFFNLAKDSQLQVLSNLSGEDLTRIASVGHYWNQLTLNPRALREQIKKQFGYDLPLMARNPLQVYVHLLALSHNMTPLRKLMFLIKMDYPPLYYTEEDLKGLDYKELSPEIKQFYFEEVLACCNKDFFEWLLEKSAECGDRLFRISHTIHYFTNAIQNKRYDFALVLLKAIANSRHVHHDFTMNDFRRLLNEVVMANQVKLAEIMLWPEIFIHPDVSGDQSFDLEFIFKSIKGGHLEFAKKAILKLGPKVINLIEKLIWCMHKKHDLMLAAIESADIPFIDWMISLSAKGNVFEEKKEKGNFFVLDANLVVASIRASHVDVSLALMNKYQVKSTGLVVCALLEQGRKREAEQILSSYSDIKPDVYTAKAALDGGDVEYAWKLLSKIQVLQQKGWRTEAKEEESISVLNQLETARHPLIKKAIEKGSLAELKAALAIPFPPAELKDNELRFIEEYQSYARFVVGKEKKMSPIEMLGLAVASPVPSVDIIIFLTQKKSVNNDFSAVPTRATLLQAVLTGNVEIFKYIVEHFPKAWKTVAGMPSGKNVISVQVIFHGLLKLAANHRQLNIMKYLLEEYQPALVLTASDISELAFLALAESATASKFTAHEILDYLLEKAPQQYRIELTAEFTLRLMNHGGSKVAVWICSKIPAELIPEAIFEIDALICAAALIFNNPKLKQRYLSFVSQEYRRLFHLLRMHHPDDSSSVNKLKDLMPFLINDPVIFNILVTELDKTDKQNLIQLISAIDLKDKPILQWPHHQKHIEALVSGFTNKERIGFGWKLCAHKNIAKIILSPVSLLDCNVDSVLSSLNNFLSMMDSIRNLNPEITLASGSIENLISDARFNAYYPVFIQDALKQHLRSLAFSALATAEVPEPAQKRPRCDPGLC